VRPYGRLVLGLRRTNLGLSWIACDSWGFRGDSGTEDRSVPIGDLAMLDRATSFVNRGEAAP
jgi:hypothetical protein